MKNKKFYLFKMFALMVLISGITTGLASATEVKFDLNGVAPVVHTVNSDGDAVVPNLEIDFDNMEFTGWNTRPAGGGQWYDAGDSIDSDTTLYAQWANGTHLPDDEDGPTPSPTPDPDPAPVPGDGDNGQSGQDSNGVSTGGQTSAGVNNVQNSGQNTVDSNLGSPTAGVSVQLAAPISFIVAGALAVIAVLMLTRRNIASGRNGKSLLKHLAKNRLCLGVASASIVAVTIGVFYLGQVKTSAATDDYIDDAGQPYNGYVTIVDPGGDEVKNITTWWRGGVKMSGEVFRNGNWNYFDPGDNKHMARGRDVFLPTDDLPERWVRYDEKGAMVKGEHALGDNWYYFDETTGAMAKGFTTLPNGKQVYYDKITGIMQKGWWDADGRTWHADDIDGHVYPFYEDGQGAGALQSGLAIAELAVRLAPTVDGYSNPIRLGSPDRAWDKISDPAAQEYIRLTDVVTGQYSEYLVDNPALASCTQAAGHVIRATVDPDINVQDTERFRNYLDGSGRWEYLGNLSPDESLDSGRLQPGDVLTTENNVHTIIYIGNDLVRQAYPNSTANTFEADYSIAQYPHLATHNTYPRSGGDTFRIYRYKGKSGTTTRPYINAWRLLAGRDDYNLGNS